MSAFWRVLCHVYVRVCRKCSFHFRMCIYNLKIEANTLLKLCVVAFCTHLLLSSMQNTCIERTEAETEASI